MKLSTILKTAVRKFLKHIPIINLDPLKIHSAIMCLEKDPTPLKGKFLVLFTPKGLESSVHPCVACGSYEEAVQLAIRERFSVGLPTTPQMDCHVLGNFKDGERATWATFTIEMPEGCSGDLSTALMFPLQRCDWLQARFDANPGR